ncbi:MAG: AraC family transcriptional regulator [Oculatellaceae cyanobacterium Prado106]|jgi:AraC-like DNA-binding protein|nr:AraC family transcriptional regulator [Oculatellaceae cyanobacterium Prado106]
MAIALSQHDYWALVHNSTVDEPPESATGCFDTTDFYPSWLGQGYIRTIGLRGGLELAIADYQHHEDIIGSSSDREHPLEYTFYLPDQVSSRIRATPYSLFGSGMAPGERGQTFAKQRVRWVSVLQNPLSLAQLARQVGLNECTLKRGFRQVFGTTAFDYLHHYRLEYAKQLLMTGEMTVAQVAQSIGFARNYFTKAFCQKFGYTPGAYRKSPEVRHFSLGSSKNSV